MKCRYSFLVFTISILFNSSLKAQLSDELLQTVYQRQFSQRIINSALTSSENYRQKQALLGIASSNDSGFVNSTLSVKNKEIIAEQAFALSKLPAHQKSIEFLFSLLKQPLKPEQAEQVYIALGKLGNRTTLSQLIQGYLSKQFATNTGIALGLYHFNSRGISDPLSGQVLLSELANNTNPLSVKHALFAIYRSTVDSQFIPGLQQILARIGGQTEDPGTLQYLCGALRKYKIIPAEAKLSALLHNKEFAVRVEALRLAATMPMENREQMLRFLNAFSDSNENIRIQASLALGPKIVASQDLLFKLADTLLSLYRLQSSNSVRFQILDGIIRLSPGFILPVKALAEEMPDDLQAELYFSHPEVFPRECKNYSARFSELDVTTQYAFVNNIGEIKKYLDSALLASLTERIVTRYKDPVVLAAFLENTDSASLHGTTPQLLADVTEIVAREKDNFAYSDVLSALLKHTDHCTSEWCQEVRGIISQSSITSIYQKIHKTAIPTQKYSGFAEYINKPATITIETTKGEIKVKLLPELAPISCASILSLIKKGFYSGIRFHRVVPGFVIQAGDPTGTGSGGPGYEIITELSPAHYKKGVFGMARSDFDTEGSQWFITTGEYYHLDGNYTVFGMVISGMDVAEKITQDVRIIAITATGF